jgi:hypothetical protein
MLTGLAILGDTNLKTISGGVNDKDNIVTLGGTSDHVLDEVTVSRGINDGSIVLGGLKLPQSNINSDTSLTLSLELIKHPSILEGSLVHFSSLLLEPLNHTLVNASKLID